MYYQQQGCQWRVLILLLRTRNQTLEYADCNLRRRLDYYGALLDFKEPGIIVNAERHVNTLKRLRIRTKNKRPVKLTIGVIMPRQFWYELASLTTSTLQTRIVSMGFSCVWSIKQITKRGWFRSDAEVELALRKWFHKQQASRLVHVTSFKRIFIEQSSYYGLCNSFS